MFLYKNLSFSISSVISIPIMLIGINGGYFPTICRVCFYISKNLNGIGALSFLRLEEEYWRSPFLINFIGVNFEAGNETREKIWSDFDAEQK